MDAGTPTQVVNEISAMCANFISEPLRSQFFHVDPVVTLRVHKSTRRMGCAIIRTLELSSIAVAHQYQGLGIGTQIIKRIHELNPYDATFVCDVFNPKLTFWLHNQNWLCMIGDSNTFYLKTQSLINREQMQ